MPALMFLVSASAESYRTNPIYFTVSKGVSANMLKISSKRRCTRKEIQLQKEADAAKEADM